MLKPLIPQHLIWLALAVGAALFGAGQYLPGHYATAAATLGSVALFLGGLGWRAPSWAVGKPLLPLTLAPFALSGHALLERYMPTLPEAWQGYASLALGVLALLSGKLIPEPVTVAPNAGIRSAKVNADGTVTVQIDEQCSFYDRVRGLC